MNSGPKKFKEQRKNRQYHLKTKNLTNQQWRRNIGENHNKYVKTKINDDDLNSICFPFINALMGRPNILHTKDGTVIYIHHNLIDSSESEQQCCPTESKEIPTCSII